MQKVLITGGNKSIGFATTTCFLQNGYDIVIVARDFSTFPLHETRVQQVHFDLRRYHDIPRLVGEIGTIDILVNNAGMMHTKSTRNVTAGTVKKSQATMSLTCLFRKAFQVGKDGGSPHVSQH